MDDNSDRLRLPSAYPYPIVAWLKYTRYELSSISYVFSLISYWISTFWLFPWCVAFHTWVAGIVDLHYYYYYLLIFRLLVKLTFTNKWCFYPAWKIMIMRRTYKKKKRKKEMWEGPTTISIKENSFQTITFKFQLINQPFLLYGLVLLPLTVAIQWATDVTFIC